MSIVKFIVRQAAMKAGDRIANHAIDTAANVAKKPENISKAKALIQKLDQSLVGSTIARRLDHGLDAAVNAAEAHAEYQRVQLEAKIKRMRQIAAAEAIGGAVILVAILWIVLFLRENVFWREEVLTGKSVIVLAVGFIVSIGLIIAGIRTLFTARG